MKIFEIDLIRKFLLGSLFCSVFASVAVAGEVQVLLEKGASRGVKWAANRLIASDDTWDIHGRWDYEFKTYYSAKDGKKSVDQSNTASIAERAACRDRWVGQTFTPAQSDLAGVSFTVKRTSEKVVDVPVRLYATDVDGRPAGEPIASGLLKAEEVADTYKEAIIPLVAKKLDTNKKYALVLEYPIYAGAAAYMLRIATDSPYPRGGAIECGTPMLVARGDKWSGFEWVGAGGKWAAKDKQYTQSDSTGLSSRTIKGNIFSDFTVRFKIKILDSGDSDTNWVGIHIRKANPMHSFSKSGYLVYYRYNGNVEIFKTDKRVVAKAATGIVPSEFRALKIVVGGKNIKVYLEDKLVLDYTDDESASIRGYLSLATNKCRTVFADFSLQPRTSDKDKPSSATKEAHRVVEIRTIVEGKDLPKDKNIILVAKTDHPLIKRLVKRGQLKIDIKQMGKEGFQITTLKGILSGDNKLIVLTAASDNGLMYGLLELKERFETGRNKGLTIDYRDHPAFKIRMGGAKFPFYLGQDAYGGWDKYKSELTDGVKKTAGWWYDKKCWSKRFQSLARARKNVFWFWHPHPYSALIEYEKFPEAKYFSDKQTRENIEMFRWILSEAKEYGIKFYILHWNIHYPPGLAKAHNLPSSRSGVPDKDSALTRSYMRYCVSTLLKTYPDLAGIGGCAGESPFHCVEFFREAVMGGIKDSGRTPALIMRTWFSSPEDVKHITRGYEGKIYLVHKLNSESVYMPRADQRIKMWRDETKLPLIALGGGGGGANTEGLFWFNPEFSRSQMKSLHELGGVGNTYGCSAPGRMSEEANKYGWNPHTPYDEDYWVGLVVGRYGLSRSDAGKLYQAMTQSSLIQPLALRQYFWDSQNGWRGTLFGMALNRYVDTTTLTSFKAMPGSKRLAGRLGIKHPIDAGFAWENPDWGIDRMYQVNEYVDALIKKEKIVGNTPEDTARKLTQYARLTLDNLTEVKGRVKANEREYARLEDRLKLNAYIGLHIAAKTKAAINFLLYNKRDKKEYIDLGLKHLAESVKWWKKVSDVSNKIHPKGIYACYGGSSRWVRWRDNLPVFEKELEMIKKLLASGNDGKCLGPLLGLKKAYTANRIKAPFTSSPPAIDGKVSAKEWIKARPVSLLPDIYSTSVVNANDCSATARALWDKKYLYLLVKVKDNKPLVNNKTGNDIWNGDSVEVGFASKEGQWTKFIFAKTKNDDKCVLRPERAPAKSVDFMINPCKDGYVLEARFSLGQKEMGYVIPAGGPKKGLQIEFNIAVNDADEKLRKSQLSWCGDINSEQYGILELTK